jgi:hypothetical protein
MEESTAAHAERTEPAVLGARYVLGESLGRGGMAEVFRARDTTLNREVAIKVFAQHSAIPDNDLRRTNEVHLIASLSHPGLVTVFDAGRDTTDPSDPFAYLVMELVEGTTLAHRIESGPLPAAEVADIAAQLAAALAYVHGRGVVHRDIKPANVLLASPHEPDATGRVTAKLTDFGIARLLDSSRLTVEGTTVGTANYLSPEQVTGSGVDPASDIYSLGLVLLEALTGEIAFPGNGVESAMARLHRDPAIPSWVGDGWRALLGDMTASDPSARPDAATVGARVRRLGPVQRDTAPTVVFAEPPASRRRRSVAWIAAALAAAAAILTVIIVVAAGSNDSSGTALAAYPKVVGALGRHLRTLEGVAPPSLHDETVAVAAAAAKGDFATSLAALRRLSTDIGSYRRLGQVSATDDRRIRSAIAAVGADLHAALRTRARAASRAAASRAAASRAAASRAAASRAAASRAAASRAAARSASAAAARRSASAAAPPPPPPHVPPGQAKKHDRGPGPGPGPGHGHGPGNDQGAGDG